jgi:hypothetical protein
VMGCGKCWMRFEHLPRPKAWESHLTGTSEVSAVANNDL